MKKVLTATLLCSCFNAYAFTCPQVVTGVTFVHMAAGQRWVLRDEVSKSAGWYIQQNPSIQNRTEKTIAGNTPLNVYLNKDASGKFYATCEYQVGSGDNATALQVSNSQAQGFPSNSLYKKVSNASYVCNTTALLPNLCTSVDINQRPVAYKAN